MDEKAHLDRLVAIFRETRDLSNDERLELLETAWLLSAANARTETLAIPGGFPAERDRQADRLNRLVALVRAEEPDLEIERLFQEGDLAGVLDHVQRLKESPGE